MYKIPANTLFMGKNLVFVPECHSTNTLALQLAQNPSTPEGTVVITHDQTTGRGQRGNTWESAPGMNLTFSALLKPAFLGVKDQFYLNIITSLAVHDFLAHRGLEPISIKWPNDILVHEKKICGILIENQVQGSGFISAIVGIGLNVNQTQFSTRSPTSVKLVTSNETNLREALEGVLGHLEARYLQLRQNHLSALKALYLSRLYWRNEKHTFSTNAGVFEGQITTVDDVGRLVVETPEGTKLFEPKEIRFNT